MPHNPEETQVVSTDSSRAVTEKGNLPPLVSVVIPAYNRIQYIRETIESVLAQTWPNVELIVVDDGSTDGTFELLQEYAEQGKLTLLHHPNRENRGQAASLNRAIEQAQGKYLSILDSDDTFESTKFERLIPILDSNPDIGLVYSNGIAVDGNGSYLYDMLPEGHIEANDPNRLLLDCYFLLPQNSVVRRTVFDQAGRFEETLRSPADHDMLLRLFEITETRFVPANLFRYRIHSGCMTLVHAERLWTEGFEVLRRAARRYPYRRATLRKRRAVLHFRMAQVYWNQRRPAKAAGHVAIAAIMDPFRSMRVLLGFETIR